MERNDLKVIALRSAVELVNEIADNKDRSNAAEAGAVVVEAEVLYNFLREDAECSHSVEPIEDDEGITDKTPGGYDISNDPKPGYESD